MNCRWVGLAGYTVGVAVAMTGLGTPVPAQQTTTVAVESSSRAADVFARKISANFRALPLRYALDSLSASANVRIQYRAEVLGVVSGPVSLQVRKTPLGIALRRMLSGMPLSVLASGDDAVTIRVARHALQVVNGSIVGKIVHAKTKQPITGVVVQRDGSQDRVLTGGDGTFRLSLEAGEHTIEFRAIGFVRQHKTVRVTSGQATTLEIELEPSANVLNEVVVTGTVVATERKAITTPITVINAEEIERRGITRVDQLFRGEVPGLLALEQGMSIYATRATENRGGTNYSVANTAGGVATKMYSRGASSLDGAPNPIKTYIDGVELLDPSYLGTIDPRMIERIEVITGPQAATIYGSGALGGVMQIFTKKGAGAGGQDITASLRFGLLETNVSSSRTPSHNHGLMMTGSYGPVFSYSANLSYLYTGQWTPALFDRTYAGSLGATHSSGGLTVSGSLSLNRSANGALDVTNTRGGSPYVQKMVETGQWNCGGGASSGVVNCATSRIDLKTISHRFTQTASLNADYQVGSFMQHHLTMGRVQNAFELSNDELSYASPSDTNFVMNNTDGSRVTLAYNTTLNAPTVRGVSNVLTLGTNAGWGSSTRTRCYRAIRNSQSCESPLVSNVIDDKTHGGFASWRLGIGGQLYLTLGLRAELNNAYGEEHKIDWTPTNGIAYTFDISEVSVKLLGSYGRATRAPSVLQRDAVLSPTYTAYDPAQYVQQLTNPALAPEYESGPQGGVEVYYGNLGSFTLNYYRQKVTNLLSRIGRIDSVPRKYPVTVSEPNGYWYQSQWQNIAKVRKQGWESTAALNWWRMNIRGTYSWNDSRVLDLGPTYTGDQLPGQPFTWVPTHTANLMLGYSFLRTSANLRWNYIGSRPITTFALPPEISRTRYRRLQMYELRGPISGSSPVSKSGYVKADMVMNHRVTSDLSVSLNINNVTNSFADDNENSMSPSLGRRTLLGLSVRM